MAVREGEPDGHDPACPYKDDVANAETADDAELARANLLRIRGDYKGARDISLSILKRRPGNLSAHVLLGDLCAEEGDLAHAAEWYDLALDLDKNDSSIQRKVYRVRERLSEREAAQAARQLGLPTSPSRAKWFAIGTACLIVAVGVSAYLLGDKFAENRNEGRASQLVNLPPVENSTLVRGGAVSTDSGESSTQETTVVIDRPAPKQTESELLTQLRREIPEGTRIISANIDLATNCLTIRASAMPTESLRMIAAQLGVGALRATDASAVLIELTSGTDVIFIGEIPGSNGRSLIDESGAPRDPVVGDLDTLFTFTWPGSRE